MNLAPGPARVFLFFLLSGTLPIAGQDEPGSALPQATARQLGYAIRHWSLEEGLPLDRMVALAQTDDGYLWAGGDGGHLSRFDGTRFVSIDTAGQTRGYSGRYTQFLADSRGGLLLRGNRLALARYFEGRFEPVPDLDQMGADDDGPMVEAADGSIWIAGRNPPRFYRRTSDRIQVIAGDSQVPPRYALHLEATDQGDIWGIWNDHTLFRLTVHGPKDYAGWEAGGDPGRNLGGLMKLAIGTLAVCGPRGVYQLHGERWALTRPWTPRIDLVHFAVAEADGTIWMITRDTGSLLCSQGNRLVSMAIPGAKDPVLFQDMILDRQGCIWIATHQGLFQVRPTLFRTWSTEEGLSGHRVLFVTPEEQSRVVIISRSEPAIDRIALDSGTDVISHQPIGFPARYALPATAGSYWLVSPLGHVHFWRNGETTLVTNNLTGGDPVYVEDVLKSRRGELWCATSRGLYHEHANTFSLVTLPDGSPTAATRGLAQDSAGSVYAVVSTGGVYVIEGRVAKPLPTTGASAAKTSFIDVTPEGDVWTVLENNQLARWRAGQWVVFDPVPTQSIRKVTSFCVDQQGGLWLGTESQGLVWIDREDLEASAGERLRPVRTVSLGRYQGLGSLACTGFSTGMARTADGHIWVATADGVSVIDPADFKRRRAASQPPSAAFEAVLVDDVPMDWRGGAIPPPGLQRSTPIIRVPPGSRRVDIRFGAVDLASGEHCRFEYRLRNYADEWEMANNGQSAVFHRLPPGQYTFEARAANPFGRWSEQVASLEMSVLPLWWQTAWFHWGLGVLAVGLLWLTRFLKLRQVQREQSRREEFTRQLIQSQEAERKRIAAELHDGLGQELLLIKASSQMARKKLDPESPAHERISSVIDLASQALAGVRRMSSELRPVILDRLGLREAVQALAQQAAATDSLQISCEVNVLDELRNADTQMNLYRILQECLNNALKHAQAKTISIRAVRDDANWVLHFEDDGKGFAIHTVGQAPGSGGHGLGNIRERAQLLRGTVTIASSPGHGTRVTILIPRETGSDYAS